MRSLIFSSILCLLLTACSFSDAGNPSISFIGIGAGSLQTPVEELEFRDTFDVKDLALVAVVGFDSIEEGTTVQATWFSPDERRMPLGRTNIVTESGATIARFSFASQVPWQPAPYMLRIDAMKGEGEAVRTTSGSLSFFIGMKQREMDEYKKEFEEWQKADAQQRAIFEERTQREKAMLDAAKETLDANAAFMLLKHDFTQDGTEDYLIGTTKEEETMPPMGGGPGVLASGAVDQFLLRDGSGAELLSMRAVGRRRTVFVGEEQLVDGIPSGNPVQITVLPSLTLSLLWEDDDQSCTVELRRDEDEQYEATEPLCIDHGN